MGFWLIFWVALALNVVGELLRPKPKIANAKPSGLGDFNFPTADPTRCIAIWCGKVKFEGPNTAWFGDLRVEAITKKVKTGWFSSQRVTQGFKYYIGVQIVFGFGQIDELFDFRLDKKSVISNLGSITTTPDYYAFSMNRPYLLGNDDPPNGVSGPVKLYRGTPTQPPNEYLRTRWAEGSEHSAFRRIVYAVFEQCYMGNSDTPPPPSMIAGHYPNGLGITGGKHRIDDDSNPACWCYEILTNTIWGMGRPRAEIDVDAFIACGEKLHAEGMGISMLVETATDARNLLGEVMRHVDGVIFNDPKTGQWTMKLARDDYNVADLFEFDNSNIVPDSFEFSRISWDETKNDVIVNYVDRDQDFTVQPVSYPNLANLFIRNGQVVSETYDFTLFTKKDLAVKAAARLARVLGSPTARVQFKTGRAGYDFVPGDVCLVSKPDFGLNGVVMRILDVSYGTADNPLVTITCTEDIFAINAYAYGPPEDTGWVPTYQASSPLRMARIVEVPYEMIDDEKKRLMVLAVRDDFVTQGFEVWMNEGGVYRKTNVAYGTVPGGLTKDLIPAPLSWSGLDLTVRLVTDIQLLRSVTQEEQEAGSALLMVNDEIMAYRDIEIVEEGGETVVKLHNVYRGMYDTMPATHPSGSPVYFFNEAIALTEIAPIANNGTYTFKLPTFNGKETLPLDSVPTVTGTVVGRAQRPNPPGQIKINGAVPLVSPVPCGGEVEVDWGWRNKAWLGPIVKQSDDFIDREPGSGARITVGGLTLNYTEGKPAYFKLASSGQVGVTVYSVDFDGQLSSIGRTLVLDYTTDGSGEEYIRTSEPVPDPEDTVTISPVGGVLTIDCANGDVTNFIVILDADCAVQFLNVPPSTALLLEVRQQGAYAITWPANVNFIQGTPYVVTPIAGAINLVGLVTLNGGATWNLKASQPGTADGQVPMIVTITPSPATASADGLAGSPVVASVQVSVSIANGTEPLTYAWERTDTNGGPNFAIDDATIENPTFSWTSSTSSLVQQQWTVNVGDADGSVAQASVMVQLQTNNSASAFAVSISPSPAFGYAAYPENPAAYVEAFPVNGNGTYTYAWEKLSGVGFQNTGLSNKGITVSRTNNNINSTRTGQYKVTVTDVVSGESAVAVVDIELETGRGGGVTP